jgi:O-antigen/teichoic acid export membrane protein
VASRRLGLSTLTYLVLAFFQRGLGLLLLPFLTRVLDPEEYGAVSIIVAGGTLTGVVLGSALESAVFRWEARRTEISESVLRVSGIYLFGIVPAVASLIALVFWLLDTPLVHVSSRIWAIEVLASGLLPAITFFALPRIRATNQLGKYVWLAGSSIFTLAAGKIVFVIILGYGLEGWVLSDLVSAALLFPVAYFMVGIPRKGVGTAAVKPLLAYSLPLVPHRLAFWALTSLSRPAMTIALSLAQIGLFSLAFNLAGVAAMVLAEINRAFLTEYSREHFPAPSVETRRVARAQLFAAIAAPAALASVIAISAPVIVDERFMGALPLVGIFMLAQAAYGVYVVPMNYIVQTAGVTGFSWIASVLGAAFIFVSILLYGAELGVIGIAIATMLGYALMALFSIMLARWLRLDIRWRLLRLPPVGTILASAGLGLSVVSLVFEQWEVRVLCACLALFILSMSAWASRSILRAIENGSQ